MSSALPTWIIATQWSARLVMVLLVFLSIWSIATMLACLKLLKEAGTHEEFRRDFDRVSKWISAGNREELQTWSSGSSTVHAGTLQSALSCASTDPAQVDRAVRSYLTLKRTTLEEGLTVLATLGSNAPFIGLFGTVLGIIQAFGALGAHQSNPSDIMVGISEALVATAIGLFVAIPAVVAFNLFSRKLRVILVNAESLRDLYLAKMGTPDGD